MRSSFFSSSGRDLAHWSLYHETVEIRTGAVIDRTKTPLPIWWGANLRICK